MDRLAGVHTFSAGLAHAVLVDAAPRAYADGETSGRGRSAPVPQYQHVPQYQSYVGQVPMQAPAKPATPAWQLVGMGVVIAVAAMKGLEWLGGQKGRIQVPPHL